MKNRNVFIFVLVLYSVISCLLSCQKYGTNNLRQSRLLTIGILTSHRENAFYLPDVVDSLKFKNLHIFNADNHHTSLRTLKTTGIVHNIYTGEYHKYLPFNTNTDAHKTRKYFGVNVVKSRKKWWRKQNMDFLKMARYLREHDKASYYLLLEDDNIFQGDNVEMLIDTNEPVVHMGADAGALLMSDAFLESFIGYVSVRTDAQPINWLLELFIDSLGRQMVHKMYFKHVGTVSTKL